MNGHVKPGSYSWAVLLPRAQKQFWNYTLPQICRTIRRHTSLSRRSLKDLPGLRQSNVITEMLDKIDATVDETLTNQGQARDFLDHYRQGKLAANA
jgi:hypothetical protein